MEVSIVSSVSRMELADRAGCSAAGLPRTTHIALGVLGMQARLARSFLG